jgi:hypothetical protein
VANFGSWQKHNWKILRVKDGLCAEWTESFSSAAEAFDYLISQASLVDNILSSKQISQN